MTPTIWVEKYRPKKLTEVVFQDQRQRKMFEHYIADGDIPNMLFYGNQGTGKTTLARVLLRELGVDSGDILRINCSNEKIEAMRGKVHNFVMTLPLGPFKVVHLEEMDYLSLEAQGLLRALIETATGTVRWIATCNYDNKIIPALRSRFQETYFHAPNKEDVALRVVDILEAEGVAYEPEHVITYIDVAYPDIRKIIQLLSQNTQEKKLLSPLSSSAVQSDWRFGLLDLLGKGDFKQARSLVIGNATREEIAGIYTFLYQNSNRLKVSSEDAAIVVIAEFMYKHALATDVELNLAACFINLGNC